MIGHCTALFVENLVMEQADSGECHSHMIFIAAFDNQIISDTSTRLCDIFDTALMSTFDVISKREECIRTERYIGQLIQPGPFFFAGEYVWFYFEDLFPCTVSQHIHIFITDINIDRIVTLCTAEGSTN